MVFLTLLKFLSLVCFLGLWLFPIKLFYCLLYSVKSYSIDCQCSFHSGVYLNFGWENGTTVMCEGPESRCWEYGICRQSTHYGGWWKWCWTQWRNPRQWRFTASTQRTNTWLVQVQALSTDVSRDWEQMLWIKKVYYSKQAFSETVFGSRSTWTVHKK